jgi:hypothetical protein
MSQNGHKARLSCKIEIAVLLFSHILADILLAWPFGAFGVQKLTPYSIQAEPFLPKVFAILCFVEVSRVDWV